MTTANSAYDVVKAVQIGPVPGKGIVLGVCPTSRGQRRDEDGLQRDEDLAEGGLLHQTFELLEVDAHAEGGAVAVYLQAEISLQRESSFI